MRSNQFHPVLLECQRKLATERLPLPAPCLWSHSYAVGEPPHELSKCQTCVLTSYWHTSHMSSLSTLQFSKTYLKVCRGFKDNAVLSATWNVRLRRTFYCLSLPRSGVWAEREGSGWITEASSPPPRRPSPRRVAPICTGVTLYRPRRRPGFETSEVNHILSLHAFPQIHITSSLEYQDLTDHDKRIDSGSKKPQ